MSVVQYPLCAERADSEAAEAALRRRPSCRGHQNQCIDPIRAHTLLIAPFVELEQSISDKLAQVVPPS
jgi:hypothetical protein